MYLLLSSYLILHREQSSAVAVAALCLPLWVIRSCKVNNALASKRPNELDLVALITSVAYS